MIDHQRIVIGTAGWSIPSLHAGRLPGDGSHLERYGRSLDATEINTSFYKPHRRETYERWAAAVPREFRFSVKLPKSITHERKLVDCGDLLDRFLAEAGGLGAKLGVILVQLPPQLRFDEADGNAFLTALRSRTGVGIALEPRHESWFAEDAEDLLREHRVARVAADPVRFPVADRPAGWPGIAYFRYHGSPRTYRSGYADRLGAIADALGAAAGQEIWCIFDNTAEGHALGDALSLAEMLR